MKVRARVPFRAYVFGPAADALSPTATFTYKRLQVHIHFAGDDPLDVKGFGLQAEPFRRLRNLEIEIDGDEGLKKLVGIDDGKPLAKLVIGISNYVLSAVRNFGTVAHLEPLRASDDETEACLRALRVETSEDGTDWTPVLTTDDWEAIFATNLVLSKEHIGHLNVRDWSLIQEALQDGLKAGPEREFYVNALEHTRVENLRLAVVESVIGLEIVLTEWLREVLPTYGLDRKTMDDVLGPALDLRTRLRLLLPILLSEKERAKIRPDAVVRTVQFRNRIAHGTGNLPEGVKPEDVRDGISATLQLVMRLADARDRLRQSPKLEALGQKFAAEHGLPVPRMHYLFEHEYNVVFEFRWADEFPSDETLTAIATDLTARMVEHDPRFRANDDVWLVFLRAGQPAALWNGKLLKPKNPPKMPISDLLGLIAKLPTNLPPPPPRDPESPDADPTE